MKEFQTKNLKKDLLLCSIVVLFMLFPQSYSNAQTVDQNVKEEESIFVYRGIQKEKQCDRQQCWQYWYKT